MIEGINSLLGTNDIMCKINEHWYKLESIDIVDGKMPIIVIDDECEECEFDMADIDEFEHTEIDIDPKFQIPFSNIIGEA